MSLRTMGSHLVMFFGCAIQGGLGFGWVFFGGVGGWFVVVLEVFFRGRKTL